MAVVLPNKTRRRVALAVATAVASLMLAMAGPVQATTAPAAVPNPGGWAALTSTTIFGGTPVNLHGAVDVVGWCQRTVVIQQHVAGYWSRTVAKGLTTPRGFFSLPVPTRTPSASAVSGTYAFRAVVLAGCGKPQWVSGAANLTILLPWNMNGPSYSTNVPVGTPAHVVGWVYDKEGCVLTATLEQATSRGWVRLLSVHTNPRGDYSIPQPTSRAGTVNYRVGVPNGCGHSAQVTGVFSATIR
ncbi:MAG TPA: hypothetical protein VFA96_06590 [Nocardioides sp.]|nr:hypothetical protein [Nocardioides sp.]